MLLREGVPNDRGSADAPLLFEFPCIPAPALPPAALNCPNPVAGSAVSDVGGTPRYASAYTTWPWIVCGEDSIAEVAASADSNVTLIQCSPPANFNALAFSSAVMGFWRSEAWSLRSDLYLRWSPGASRG